MTAPAATVCDLCGGEGTLLVLDLGQHTTSGDLPCPWCSVTYDADDDLRAELAEDAARDTYHERTAD